MASLNYFFGFKSADKTTAMKATEEIITIIIKNNEQKGEWLAGLVLFLHNIHVCIGPFADVWKATHENKTKNQQEVKRRNKNKIHPHCILSLLEKSIAGPPECVNPDTR